MYCKWEKLLQVYILNGREWNEMYNIHVQMLDPVYTF